MHSARIICGLGYGDEGKGVSVDALCRETNSDLVVRYTGGPQCTHTVVLSDGREHRFSQFGSGSFLPNCRTHIARQVLVEPFAMMNEAHALSEVGVSGALDRMTVDPDCIIITPWHWMGNKIRETLRGEDRHGSCGMGIGETKAMIERGGPWLSVRDLGRPAHGMLMAIRESELASLPPIESVPASVLPLYDLMLNENVDDLMDYYNDWARAIGITSYVPSNDCVFEGAQGVLLDEVHGFAPHNTWSCTTFDNALSVCRSWMLKPVKIGVLRTYMTRHGAGPFITEDNENYKFTDHNTHNPWQGKFRQGAFDMVLARYAVKACSGVDQLILTHCDRVSPDGWKYRDEQGMQVHHGNVGGFIAEHLGVPVSHLAFGPTAGHVHEGMPADAVKTDMARLVASILTANGLVWF